jgi:hypothetical protein
MGGRHAPPLKQVLRIEGVDPRRTLPLDAADLPYDNILQPIPSHHGHRSTPDGDSDTTAPWMLSRQLPPC